jgi:hypothetical protein
MKDDAGRNSSNPFGPEVVLFIFTDTLRQVSQPGFTFAPADRSSPPTKLHIDDHPLRFVCSLELGLAVDRHQNL